MFLAVPLHLRELFPAVAVDVEACKRDNYLLAAKATFPLAGSNYSFFLEALIGPASRKYFDRKVYFNLSPAYISIDVTTPPPS
jgi:hypothetical protein